LGKAFTGSDFWALSHRKISNFRMWIERIIKQRFYHDFKISSTFIFLYRKYSIGEILIWFSKLNSVAFMLMHLGASWVQKGFKNAFRCWPNPSENFPDFSGIYSQFLRAIFIY
jgi:hypothetical protein